VAAAAMILYLAAPATARDVIRLATSKCGVFPALPVIAAEKGYFEENDLAVERYESADFDKALEDLEQGEYDVAMSTDLPTVIHIVDGGSYTVFANLAYTGRSQGILAGKDQGVEEPADLAGKTIGVMKGTGPHFFLQMYLLRNDLLDKVEIVYLSYPEIIPAFIAGKVDAYCMWPDMIFKGRERYDGETVFFTEENLVIKTAHIGSSKKYVRENPDVLENFLRAMIQADRFMKEHREEALKIVAADRGRPVEKIDREWKEWNFNISLYQSLILGFESMAEWAVEQGLTESESMPEFLDHVHVKTLKRIEPERVTIIE
jgi:NitT/TauT family transport system substrate-binding protein